MRAWKRCLSAATIAWCFFPRPLVAQITVVPDPARTIYVTGRGSVSAAPDTANVTLGVASRDLELKKAKASVDEALRRLTALVQRLSLPLEGVKTSSVNVTPRHSVDGSETFLGYEVTRSITITLRDIDKLDALLDGGIEAGANRDFDVSLGSSREPQLKQEALSKALADARAQADFAVGKMGLRVGAVRSMSLNKSSPAMASASAYVIPSARFLPGEIKVDAEASVSFLIEDGIGSK